MEGRYGVKATDEGWEGVNARIWHGEDELKKMLKEEFKKNGLKVSVRSRRAGYLTALDFTMKIQQSDICSEEEFKARKKNVWELASWSKWLSYVDADGQFKRIAVDDLLNNKEGEERIDLEKRIWHQGYLDGIHRIESGYSVGDYICDYLSDEAISKFRKMRIIVASFNHDESDGMTDYFDRDIYDDYYLKVA